MKIYNRNRLNQSSVENRAYLHWENAADAIIAQLKIELSKKFSFSVEYALNIGDTQASIHKTLMNAVALANTKNIEFQKLEIAMGPNIKELVSFDIQWCNDHTLLVYKKLLSQSIRVYTRYLNEMDSFFNPLEERFKQIVKDGAKANYINKQAYSLEEQGQKFNNISFWLEENIEHLKERYKDTVLRVKKREKILHK
jgi:hypothetical protein